MSAPGQGGEKLGRKEHALLAFLALHAGRPQARSKLASLLWGNILEDSARQDLRQALSKLRHALNDPDHSLIKSVKIGGDEAVLFNSDAIEVDATLFENLSRRGDRASLEAAADLYAGDLLDGLEVRIDTFESWLGGERARLRHLAVDTLVRVSKLRSDAGENQAAIDSLHSALRLDPLREDACRQLMQLYASIGRRSAALQEYSALQDHLRRELQTEPEPATLALADSIRHGSAATHKEEVPSNAVAVTAPIKVTVEPKARTRKGRRRIVVTVTVVLLGALILLLLPAAVYWRIPELAPQPIGAIILYAKEGYLGRQITPETLSIAVLPFTAQGDADADDYAEAISEGTASMLSMVSEMRVVPQLSVIAAVGNGGASPPVSPGTIGQRLNVRYLLEGNVLKSASNISVTIDLIDTAQGDTRALTETISRQGTDIIALQRAISFEIISKLNANLLQGEKERIDRAHSSQNVEALFAAGRGEKLLRRLTKETNLQARSSYEEATALDSNYAGAWDGLAWTYLLEVRFGWTNDPTASLKKAEEFAQRTLALDPNRPRTYSLLGSLQLIYGNHAQAIADGEKAVTLEANDADAAALLAYTYTYVGQPQRAEALVERAIKLRPYPPEWYVWLLGRAQRLDGRYQAAISTLRPAMNANPPALFSLIELATAYGASGQLGEAKAVGVKILEIRPDFSCSGWARLAPYKDPADAQSEIDLLKLAGLPD